MPNSITSSQDNEYNTLDSLSDFLANALTTWWPSSESTPSYSRLEEPINEDVPHAFVDYDKLPVAIAIGSSPIMVATLPDSQASGSSSDMPSGNQAVSEDQNKTEEMYIEGVCYFAAFIALGGLITGLYFLCTLPCRHLAFENLTGDTLDFTSSSAFDDDYAQGCTIDPYENILTNSSFHMDKGEFEHCTFDMTNGIKLRSTARDVNTIGEDEYGCVINPKRSAWQTCSYKLFKDCPEIVDDEPKSLLRNTLRG